MKTSDFDYYLPPEMIAQTPIEPRDHSRLMVIDRADGSIRHRKFYELVDYLKKGDVLIFNNSRVINARLSAIRLDTGKECEVFLLSRLRPNVWETLMRSKKKVTVGTGVRIVAEKAEDSKIPVVEGEVVELREGGIRVMAFSDESELPRMGKIPLPPYIHQHLENPERYQTVFSEIEGSVAAPTAGLHFTPELLERIKGMGVKCLFVSLHIGIATFRPVREEDPTAHRIHQEYGIVSEEVADAISEAKVEGRRVICVGTTSVRLIEAVANEKGVFKPYEGWVDLYILPGYRFKVTDVMVTNFHLPKSTLLMLVSAFAGKELIDKAYQEAIAEKYRFYSFGDAMLIG